MLLQPLLWLYLFFQFQIFIYFTNRVAFHPRFRVLETEWTLAWSLFTLSVQSSLTLLLAHYWDFDPSSWLGIPMAWKLFTLLLGASVTVYWMEFFFWLFFVRKPTEFRLLSRRALRLPPRFKTPYGYLKNIGFENQIYQPEMLEYEVRLPHWPKEFSGFSLVQISDVHFGKYINLDYLGILVQEAQKMKPDLFALTGDFISFQKHVPALKGLFRKLKAPLGVYGLLGNHDYWSDGKGMRRTLENDRVKVLCNEVVYFRRKGKTLALMGADDLWEGVRDNQPILDARADAKILMAHNPDHFPLGKKAGAQLQISGHCHGGQICFPFLGPLIIPSMNGRKYAGGFVREGNTTLFVNRGIGGYPPLRTNCPPEIVKLILKSA